MPDKERRRSVRAASGGHFLSLPSRRKEQWGKTVLGVCAFAHLRIVLGVLRFTVYGLPFVLLGRIRPTARVKRKRAAASLPA